MLLLFPVVFILVVKTMYKSKRFFRRLFFCTVFFVLGFLPYLYLPIAASFSPPVNWNNPVTLQNFLHLVLRQDYGWTPKAVIDNSVRLLFVKRYFIYFISELTFLGVILITLGMVFSFWRSKKLLVTLAFLLGFFLFGPFFFYYGAGPSFDRFSDGAREKFYASSLIFLVFFLPFGIDAIMFFFRRIFEKIGASEERIKLYQKVIIFFFFLLPFILFVKNVKILNIRDSTRITEVLASQLLINLPKDSVFVAQHDNILFPLWYMQFSNNRRQDIFVILPKELSRLAKRGMFHLDKPSVSRAENLDSYVDVVAFSLSAPVFISETDYHSVVNGDDILLYPYGLVWKYATNKERRMSEEEFIKKQGALLSQLSDPNKLLSKEKKDRLWLLTNIPLFYAHAYTNTGYFLMHAYHDYPLARKYFQKAITIDDQDHWGYEGLGISYYQQKQYKKARDAFKQAVTIQPLNHNAYFLLYGTYLALEDKKSAKELEEFFKQYKEIYSEFKFEKTRVKVPR